MYFFFSKVLLFAILPANWIFILAILSFIVRNKKVRLRLRIAAFVIFLIFGCPYIFIKVSKLWDVAPEKIDPHHKYSSAIVLGGFTSFNSDGAGFFNSSADRFIQALKLHSQGRVQRILITGGSGNLIGNKMAEAPFVREQLLEMNVPDSDILVEGRSKNTLENAKFTRDTLNKHGLKGPYILVTSAFHMRRSLYIFRKAGLDVIAYPCNYMLKDDFVITDLLPDVSTLGDWNTYLKEYVGYIVAHFQKV